MVQKVQFRSAGRFVLLLNFSWLLDSVEAALLCFCSVPDCLVCAHWSFCILTTCVWQIFGDFWFQSLAFVFWIAPKMWNTVVDRCFQVMCVRGRVCGSVCLCMSLHCHKGFDLCTSCYWLPLICWSKILTKTDILVWRWWTNKHQPVNISQGRYEGGGCDCTLQLQGCQSRRPASPFLNIHMSHRKFM